MDTTYKTTLKSWKIKAHIQNLMAKLPSGMSYKLYFQMQRHFGNLRKPFSPFRHFSEATDMLKRIKKHGGEIEGKYFFEVGTGYVPIFPVAFWLAGSEKTTTIDLNPYVQKTLIEDMLFYVRTQSDEIRNIFGDYLDAERFHQLFEFSHKDEITTQEFLSLCNIEYIVGDASKTNIPDARVDYHISHTVYEHIPLATLSKILAEGNRITKDNGLFINLIDYSDHFANMDRSISSINFLQYSDEEWNKWAGNRYMYMNRARHNDFLTLFENAGHIFLEITSYVDADVENMLNSGKFRLDAKFVSLSTDILSIISAMFVTQKNNN